MRWGRSWRGHGAAAASVLALTTSCVANQNDGATATIDAPARKVVATAMLQKLDLAVPRDLEMPPPGEDAPAPAAAAPSLKVFGATASADDASRALDCLTKAVYYEAGNQSDDGERAVAQVVLNRVRDRAFPSSVCGVVYQGSTRSTGCQFTFTCDGSLNRAPSPAGWARARAIASAALGGEVYAPVGSATFYHANYVSPWWAASMEQVATVGAHIFYRWRGGMERALAFRQSYSGVEPQAVARAAVASTSVNGVTVSYGSSATAGSVAIHRGEAPGAAAVVTPAVVTTPVAVASGGAKLVQVGGGRGIRVHRGVSSAGAGEDYSDQATVD